MTQQQYMVLKQPTRHVRVKVDIINDQNNIINSLQGIATGGNINIEATSTYRRSGSLTLLISKKNNVIPSPSSNIWFNKRIGISVGVTNYNDEVIWFNLGRFAVMDCDLNFGNADLTMNVNLADLMAFLDGSLGGILSHEVRMENKGVKINQAISSILNGLVPYSIEKVTVDGEDALLPYEIEKPEGTTAFQLIQELNNLYMGYQFYFDANGYFILEKIRDKKDDSFIWDFQETNFSLNSSSRLNFANVKNDIWVYGRTDEYNVQVIHNYCNRFARNNISEMNDITQKDKNDICYINSEDSSYVWNGVSWNLLDFNVIPFLNIESIGRKKAVFTDENIFTEGQAKLRSQYQLESFSTMLEVITFGTVPIYSLDVNRKIRVKKEEIGIDGDYLIQSIGLSLDVATPMTITASKLYYEFNN